MKRFQHLALAGLLSAAALTTACDRDRSPGQDTQTTTDFSTAPPARTIETDMDSVNNQQSVQPATGKGSAPDQMQAADPNSNAAPSGTLTTDGNTTPTPPNQPSPVQKVTGN